MKENIRKILGLPVTEPIEYWEKYWEHFTKALSEKDNCEAVVDSPRFVIENIISEIEYNDLKNKDNRELFKSQLSNWLKHDKVFKNLFSSKAGLLLSKMSNNDCSQYLLCICKKILIEIEEGKYFNELIQHLIKVIEDYTVIDYNSKQEINRYTELIISEFIAKGFAIDDISNVNNDKRGVVISELGDIIIAPAIYYELKLTDFDSEDLYHEAIKMRMKSRTISERISALRDNYYEEPTDCYVLIRLTGLIGDINCMVGDINIYSPQIKRYITEEHSISTIEQVLPDRKYINAAIPVKHRALHSSIAYGIQKLEKIIDLLAITFNTSKPISYSNKDVSIVESGNFVCGSGIGTKDMDADMKHQEFVKYILSLDVSTESKLFETTSERITYINDKQDSDCLKLSTAAHWFQKGKYSQLPEDKLLFHWIAIESLLKTNSIIYSNITGKKDANLLMTVQKIASAVIVKAHFYSDCYNMYNYINYLTQNEDNYLDIPEEIVEKASLNMKAGDKVDVSKFLNNLKEIYLNINDEIRKTELQDLETFYRDGDGINAKQKKVESDLILIYRLRNLIAHNAVYPKALIDIFANKAQNISLLILRHLIDTHRKMNLSINEILVNTASDYDEFVQNIGVEIKHLKS